MLLLLQLSMHAFLKINIAFVWSMLTCLLLCHRWQFGQDRLQRWWVVVVFVQWWDIKSPVSRVIFSTSDDVSLSHNISRHLSSSARIWRGFCDAMSDRVQSDATEVIQLGVASSRTLAVDHIKQTGASWRGHLSIIGDWQTSTTCPSLNASSTLFRNRTDNSSAKTTSVVAACDTCAYVSPTRYSSATAPGSHRRRTITDARRAPVKRSSLPA